MPLPRHRGATRGFTYLGVLLLLVLLGALLAGVGQKARLGAQRERERELLFRGQQIAQAISSYRASVQPPAWPQRLDDLLVDRRQAQPVHHLRRLWTDPHTRQADWVLLPAPPPAVGFIGVHSRVDTRRLLQTQGPPDTEGPLLSDWRFMAPLLDDSAEAAVDAAGGAAVDAPPGSALQAARTGSASAGVGPQGLTGQPPQRP